MESLLSLLVKAEGNINVKAWKVRERVKWDQLISIAETSLSHMYEPERKDDVKHGLANIKKAEELIGYKP